MVNKGRVLVTDDEPYVSELMVDLLSGDYEVVTAAGGRAALAIFEPGRYDIALVDLTLPDMRGDQVALEIKRTDPAIATVMVTGWNIRKDSPEMAAFDFCIEKPFTLTLLKDTMSRAMVLHCERAGRNAENQRP